MDTEYRGSVMSPVSDKFFAIRDWMAREGNGMLELYHHGSSVCAAKVRFVLMEKGLEWKSHYLDILSGEHLTSEYLELNPNGVVPTLVHDGQVLIESTVICEYLDEEFPQVPLKPKSSLARARMRLWTKAVDEHIQPACKYITYASCHRHIIRRMPAEKLEEYLVGPADILQTRVPGEPNWAENRRAITELGIAAPGVASRFQMYDNYLHKMEIALEDQEWLAGDEFTLADISMAPYVNRLDMLGMSEMWSQSRPRVADWFERVRSRETFKPCFLDWCPADLTNDLRTYGQQTWPEVCEILQAERS